MRSVARCRDAVLLCPRSALILLFVVLGTVTGVRGLSNVSIDIPLAVTAGSTVNMTCRYDLQSDVLYTVKWYKGPEFFRYVPKEMPPIAVFGLLGGRVDTNKSDANRVILKDVQPSHSGKYRCEVSGDMPSFNTVMVWGFMNVVSLPDGQPEVHLEKLRYAVGDTVRGNCSVPLGNPPANVTWTVNGMPLNASFIINNTDKIGADNQQVTLAGLDYEITPDSFNNGRLHIICNASVFHLYQKEADILLYEERPRLASVLGTRESSYITGTSAKPIAEWLHTAIAGILLLCNLR